MSESGDQEVPRRRNPLLAPVRILVHWIIKVLVVVVLGIRALLRPKVVRYGLVGLVFLGLVGWQLVGQSLVKSWASPSIAPSQAGSLPVSAPANLLPPSAVVERYIQAEADFDAETMWALLGDDMKESFQSANPGASWQQLQLGMDSVKLTGRRYVGATYVGGMPLSGGSSVYFYVVKVETPSGGTEIPYIYVVGPDGKIASIE